MLTPPREGATRSEQHKLLVKGRISKIIVSSAYMSLEELLSYNTHACALFYGVIISMVAADMCFGGIMAGRAEIALSIVEQRILNLVSEREYDKRQIERKPTNRQIALTLGISLHRVRFCIRKINKKLNTPGDVRTAYKVARQLYLV